MKQPDILIVMTDHQRADTVRPEHPAPTPHCCPSRATLSYAPATPRFASTGTIRSVEVSS